MGRPCPSCACKVPEAAPVPPDAAPAIEVEVVGSAATPWRLRGARAPPASTTRARQTTNAPPACAQTSLSSCGAARWTSHAMLITGVCGSRAGVRASKSATDIPVCSTPLERLEEVVAPLVHVVAPLSPSHDTCHEARNRESVCGARPGRRRGCADRHHALGPHDMSQTGSACAIGKPGRPPHVQRRALGWGMHVD